MSGLEIIGLISSIIGFIEIGIETGSRVKDFLDAAKEGPEAFRDLVIVLQLLKLSLECTKSSFEQENTSKEGRDTVLVVITRCNQHVNILNTLLENCTPVKDDSSARKAFKACYSLLREKKINQLTAKLLTLRDALTDFNVNSRNTYTMITTSSDSVGDISGAVENPKRNFLADEEWEKSLLADLEVENGKPANDIEMESEVQKEEACLEPLAALIEAEGSDNGDKSSLRSSELVVGQDVEPPQIQQAQVSSDGSSSLPVTAPLYTVNQSSDPEIQKSKADISANLQSASINARMAPKTPQISSALNAAARAGKTRVIRLLLNTVKEKEAKKSLSEAALLEAVGWNQTEAVKTLLEFGALGATEGALPRAAREGNTTIIDLLLRAGAELNAKFNNEGVTLNFAAMYGRFNVAKQLIAAGAKPDGNGDGHFLYGTPLNTAIRCRCEDIALALLEAGANPKQPGALQFAAACNQIAVAKNLLDRGADINFAGKGHTPLADAVTHGNNEMVKMLLGRGADPNMKFDRGNSALACAILHRNVEGALILLDKGADPNTKDLAAFAAGKNLTEVVDAMIKAGGDVNSDGGVGGTVLITAIVEGRKDMVKYLLEKGADVNGPGRVYKFPLMAALSLRHKALAEEMAILLLEAGADPNTPGAFEKAAEQGLEKVLEFMSTQL